MWEYTLVRSKRRSLSLQITEEGELVVKAPCHLPEREIEKFLIDKQDWIQKRLAEVERQLTQYPPKQWAEGEQFYYLGRPCRLELEEMPGLKEIRFRQERDRLVLTAAELSEEVIRYTILYWYRQEAKEVIPKRVRLYNEKLGLPVHSVTIKEQKKRWGSCSSLGNLNFNWKLIMAPVEVLDYVVVHELCHFYEMNHSPDFWARVEAILPDYKKRRKWLKDNEGMFRLE